MKIACFLVDENQKRALESRFEGIRIYSEALNRNNIREVLDVEILVSRAKGIDLKLDSRVLSKFGNLKYICSMSTGFDHIDLDYCKKKGIIVSNVPSYAETSVAEHTFALILAISRKIPQSVKPVDREFDQSEITGFDLKGKTLGVIGSGKIGLEVIKIAKGFGMEVIVYDVVFNNKAKKELGYEYVSLDELLRASDIVSVHAPYNKHTFHMLNRDNLFILKNGAVLINTSRGELIESKALLAGLKNGKVRFAGLDVLEEGSKANKELLEMENVFVTPHNAANSIESKRKVLEETIANLEGFIKGDKRNVVE